MGISRRDFLKLGSLAMALPGGARAVPFALEAAERGFEARLLPTKQQVWDWQLL